MMPWPISTFPGLMSMTPSGLTAAQRSRRALRARLGGREAVVISGGLALTHFLARTTDRTQDAIVGTTATKMDVERRSDLCVRRRGIAVEQSGRPHNDARQAVAALPRLFLDEGLLQRVESRATPKSFYCRDGPGLHGRHGGVAGLNAASIEQNSAASTHTLSATEPRTLQFEVVSQDVDERRVRVRCDGASCTVDIKFDGAGQGSKLPRPSALAIAGTAYTYSIKGLQASVAGSSKFNHEPAVPASLSEEPRGRDCTVYQRQDTLEGCHRECGPGEGAGRPTCRAAVMHRRTSCSVLLQRCTALRDHASIYEPLVEHRAIWPVFGPDRLSM